MKISVYHTSSAFKTLGDFLSQEGTSPAFNYVNNPKSFLDFKDDLGLSNLDKIKLSYNNSDKLLKDLESKLASFNFNLIEIIVPTVFTIDAASTQSDLFQTQGNLVQPSQNVNYFISQELADMVLNPGYVVKSKNKQSGGVKSLHPKMTVWIWSRVLSSSLSIIDNRLSSDYELINLTPFISQLNVSSNKQGASFSLNLAPVQGVYSKNSSSWKIVGSSIIKSNSGLEYTAISSFDNENGELNSFFFHNIIQANDLIFISFEELLMEKNEYKDMFSIPFSAINSKKWDLIGLIDGNEISASKEPLNVSINISGRDLTKLIIEDGSYFWSTEFGMDGTFRFAGNRENRISRRVNVGPDGLASYFSVATKSIEGALKFIITQLANTGLVPNVIFDNYGDRKSTIFIRNGEESTEFNNEKKEISIGGIKETDADGVWAITKIIVDPQISNLRLVDASLFTEQGSFINYIQRICQEPFVEFYTETIADQFYWIARKPPHNQKSYLDAIAGDFSSEGEITKSPDGYYMIPEFTVGNSLVLDIENIDLINLNLGFDERAYSWYKLESKYALGGGATGIVSNALLPAIFIPSYTNLYGSRPYNASTNYVNYVPTSGTEDVENYLNAVEQAFYDLAWLIETHSYLPFSRRGTITINEDRRIKKGMHIRINPSDEYPSSSEIFLVLGVTHQFTSAEGISRTTTLQVERGLIEKYISGIEIEGVGLVSYFNLVKTPIDIVKFRGQTKKKEAGEEEVKEEKRDAVNEVIANWEENEKVIDFFVKRRQFK